MPIYPAMALLLGSAMAVGGKWIRGGTRVLTFVSAACALAIIAILIAVRHVPAPGDISQALGYHPKVYSLSLGHMEDLTLDSFAYLKLPLAMAALAFLVGVAGTLKTRGESAFLAAALMMAMFYQAARVALIDFDPFLSSRPLANAILESPPGEIIMDSQYWTLSTIPFYTGRSELMLNGRWFNLEYGSYAPGAPQNVFIDDADFKQLWFKPTRYYLVTKDADIPRLESLIGAENLTLVAKSGGKRVYTNSPIQNPPGNRGL